VACCVRDLHVFTHRKWPNFFSPEQRSFESRYRDLKRMPQDSQPRDDARINQAKFIDRVFQATTNREARIGALIFMAYRISQEYSFHSRRGMQFFCKKFGSALYCDIVKNLREMEVTEDCRSLVGPG
jgi:hypothetical protein